MVTMDDSVDINPDNTKTLDYEADSRSKLIIFWLYLLGGAIAILCGTYIWNIIFPQIIEFDLGIFLTILGIIIGIIIGICGIIATITINKKKEEEKTNIFQKFEKLSRYAFIFFMLSIIFFSSSLGGFLVYHNFLNIQLRPEPDLIISMLPNGEIVRTPYNKVTSPELSAIFPQISLVPFAHTQIFGTNGKAVSFFHDKDALLNEKMQYTEITFNNYCNTNMCNSGWMICPLMAHNATEFSYLTFYTRGAIGNENFGLKVKDQTGVELSVQVLEYAKDHHLGTKWQKISIPFNHFENITTIDWSSLDIITFYTDGTMTGNNPTTIYITDIDFE